MGKNKICLAMIVKNEEQDIRRCLDSVKDHIDYWVISDTGSEDNTKQLIQEIMDEHGVPGELHEHKWKDFSTNRNYVLELAKEHGDFVWFMDADDNFVPQSKRPLNALDKDEHEGACIEFQVLGYKFTRNCIINVKHNWAYHGVLHEVLMIDGEPTPTPQITNCHIVARSSPTKRAETEEEKYRQDAKILLKEYKKDPSNTRTIFYLAQSYRDCGDHAKSIKYYKERLKHPDKGFKDELEISAIELTKGMVKLGKSPADCLYWAMKAWEYNPYRIEPAILLMEIYMMQDMYFAAFAIGQAASGISDPNKVGLHHNSYDRKVRFRAHYSYACYRIGLYNLSVANMENVLKEEMTEEERQSHEKHYKVYKKAMEKAFDQ